MSRTTRKTNRTAGSSEKPNSTGTSNGSLELSTRDLYCIQTIHEQQDIFKLLVSLWPLTMTMFVGVLALCYYSSATTPPNRVL